MLLPKESGRLWAISLVLFAYLLRVTVLADDNEDTTTSSSSDQTQFQDSDEVPNSSQLILDDSDDEIKIEEEESDGEPLRSSSGAYYFKKPTTPESETHSIRPPTPEQEPQSSKADTAVANLYQSAIVSNATKEDRNASQKNDTSTTSSTPTKLIKTTVTCLPKELLLLNENNTSMVVEPTVEIVNFTQLIQEILLINTSIKAKTTPANCTIVYFYAHWCKFSAKAAAHVNALARVFPSIRTIAIDCSVHSTVSSHFGVLAVPTILLFHNGKTIAKFNDTTFTLNKFAEFIQYFTDQKYDEKLLNVTSKDFQGPIPSTQTQERDIWLFVAWIFIIVCFVYYTSRSILWRRVVDLIRTTWREAEAQQQHEHID